MGRTSLLMVLAFNVIFALVGKNLGSISSQAYMNYRNYYYVAQSRFLTESVANLVAGRMAADTNTNPYFPTPSITDTLWGGSLTITRGYVRKYYNDYNEFTIVAKYPMTGPGIIDTTILDETKTYFSQYAMYSINENGIYWKDGEVCNGPLYTQDRLNIDGSPIFNGLVTAVGGWTGDAGANPIFNNNFLRGPAVFLPNDLSSILADATGGKLYTVDTYVDFNATDGKIYVRTGSYTGTQVAGSPFASIDAFVPNGDLVVQGANLHIKGQIDGHITASAVRSGSSGGNVYIDSSITYKVPPLLTGGATNLLCDDLLGIVADRDVIIDDNLANPASLTINGSILCRTGGLVAENYDDTRRIGTLTLVGGLQQFDRKGVGTFNSSTGAQVHGFAKNYSYDPRLQYEAPPSYPKMQRYRVLSWYDKVYWDQYYWDNNF
ncbi:MAG: hypothetical protein ABSD46_05020 [Bacteroidota bacterium]